MKFLRNALIVSILIPRYGHVNGQAPNPDEFKGFAVNKYARGSSDGNPPDSPDACGLACRGPDQYNFGLLACLRNAFEVGGEMPRVDISSYGDLNLPKVVFSPSTTLVDGEFNLTEYNIARLAHKSSRLPAAVLYAETTEDVVKGVNCARVNGFKVSPRGRSHDYSGLATLGGSLVIDLQLNCKMESFEADKSATGKHILPGSRYVGKMRVPSGCTNAVFLAAVYDDFKEDAGMNVIGSCPSVGVTGFILNGGYGDVTPFAGLGSDVVDKIEMVLYNGKAINASATENKEIFWASKGGSGGLGVITNFWARIIKNPSPQKRFIRFSLFLVPASDLTDEEELETQVDIHMKFQEFLFENPKATLFGGAYGTSPLPNGITPYIIGIFLGSTDELLETLSEADLLRADFLATEGVASRAFSDGGQVCSGASCSGTYGDTFPPFGFTVAEYNTQAEAQATQICVTYFTSNGGTSFEISARGVDICSNFDIDQEYCYTEESTGVVLIQEPNCYAQPVVDAFLEAAKDPQGFLNRPGRTVTGRAEIDSAFNEPNTIALGSNTLLGRGTGGLMLPKLQRETFRKLLRDTPDRFNADHLVHGAPREVSPGSTGFPHRNTVWNTPAISRTPEFINVLLQDSAFNGNFNEVQIYANYNPSVRIPNYENHVFVDKVEELSCIRTKVDPLGGFDSPRYPQRSRNYSTKQENDPRCLGKKKKAKKGK